MSDGGDEQEVRRLDEALRNARWSMDRAHEERDAAIVRAEAAEKRVTKLEAQLPTGMSTCTILFRECEKGHGRLTATNWVDHGCDTCERDKLRAARDRAEKRVAELEASRDLGESAFEAVVEYHQNEEQHARLNMQATQDLLDDARAALARSEAAAGQMRVLLPDLMSAIVHCTWEKRNTNGPCEPRCTLCLAEKVLDSDAGRGWVSPDAHAAVVAERDRLNALLSAGRETLERTEAKLNQANSDWGELRARAENAEADLAAVTAQAAAMREAIGGHGSECCYAEGDFQGNPRAKCTCGMSDRRRAALEDTAGLAYSEEMAALRAVAEAARRHRALRDYVELGRGEFADALARLSRLDAARATAVKS